jgi:GT2 family glycosyltransferase
LRRTLNSLVELNYPAALLDLLVVDNAPEDDATAQLVAEFPQIRYVMEPRPGLNWARNRAAREALGSIVAYTDDDVAIDPLWVQALARHFENEAVMCVTGLVVPAARETAAQNIFEEYGGFGRGFERRYYTMGMQKHWRYWPLGAGVFGTGCNMAYRKSLFAKIGDFDPALDVGTPTHGAGDHDMFYRTLRAGYVVVYEPAALIWHYHRPSYEQLRDQLYDFGCGVYAFWTKTFFSDAPMRWRTLTFAMLWYKEWFIERLLHRPKGFPRRLVLVEAMGALRGLLAYWQSRRQVRRILKQFGEQQMLGEST